MDTDKINAKKHSTDSNFLKRKKCNYFNIHGKMNYKIGKLPLLICLMYFVFVFQTSFCHRLNKRKLATNQITLKFAMLKKQTNAILINKIDGVSSMVFNGASMTIASKKTLEVGDHTLVVTYSKTLTDCSSLFTNSKATFIDISQFDTSQCTSFASTFKSCSALSSIILGENFSTAKAKDMTSMFDGCCKSASFTIDRLDFDTSQVTMMKRMFADTSFQILDLSSFNTAKVV
jgi:surface protein